MYARSTDEEQLGGMNAPSGAAFSWQLASAFPFGMC